MKNELQKRILSSIILIPITIFFIIKGSYFFNFLPVGLAPWGPRQTLIETISLVDAFKDLFEVEMKS